MKQNKSKKAVIAYESDKDSTIKNYQIIQVEGCKYIIFFQKYEGKGVGIVHAGNCQNEIHQNK